MMRSNLASRLRALGGTVALTACLGAACGGGSAAPDASGVAGSGGTPGSAGAGGSTGGSGATAGSAGGTSAQTVVTGEDRPSAIAVDDAFVYWTTATAVRRMSKSGGTPATVVPAQAEPGYLAADAANLYWANRSTPGSGLFTAAKTGGQATMLAGGRPATLQIDGEFAYWVDGVDRILWRTSKAGGGTPEMLASQQTFGTLSLDDQSLYWAEGYMGRVRRIAKTGGAITDLRPADPNYAALSAVDDAFVYFTTYTSLAQSSALLRVSKAGGAGDPLASALDEAIAILTGGESVYWLTAGDGVTGYLARIPKTGGAAAPLVSDVAKPAGIALDAQYVYWTESGDSGIANGRIRRVAR
jgi:hypothetical protein